MAQRNQRSEHRRAHRTRRFFDAISALEIAVVLILHSLAKTQPVTAKLFVQLLDHTMKSEEGMTAGSRENLLRMRKVIYSNNRKAGLH